MIKYKNLKYKNLHYKLCTLCIIKLFSFKQNNN